MPRIRYLKNYEQVKFSPTELVEPEVISGAHWLSNEVILHNLPIEKLRASLDFHKNMVHSCEAEIHRRRTEVNTQNFAFPLETSPLGTQSRGSYNYIPFARYLRFEQKPARNHTNRLAKLAEKIIAIVPKEQLEDYFRRKGA